MLTVIWTDPECEAGVQTTERIRDGGTSGLG